MKIGVAVATLAVLVVGGAAWAGIEDTNQPPPVLRLELDLVDGSHIIGIPKIESVPVQTSYAKVDIPLKQIASVKLADDHETASLDCVNGDKLKGAINLKPLELTTVFGPVKIGIEHVREIVVTSGEGLSAALKECLVLYYSFDRDEGGKVTDKSGKKNDGKVHGASWVSSRKPGGGVPGRADGALNFNGTGDYITALNNIGISGAASRTMAAWVYHMDQDSFVILEWGTASPNRISEINLNGAVDGNLVQFHKGWGAVKSATGVPYNTWTHIAVTTEGSTVKFYIDGVLNNTADAGTLDTVDSPVWIAWETWAGAGHSAKGRMDEVMIFNRALSAEEVKLLHNAQRGGSL